MKLTTKYDIDDIVLFKRKQETVGGKPIENPEEVGIIEKILFNGKTVNYLMRSSYQNWVSEEDIVTKLFKGSK